MGAMSRTVGITVLVLGLLTTVCGVALLLIVARHDPAMRWVGIAPVLLGMSPLLRVQKDRRRPLLGLYAVAIAATVAAWAIARSSAGGDPEPSAPVPAAAPTGPLSSSEALARGLSAAREAIVRLDRVADYTFTVAKRERAKNMFGDERLTDSLVRMKIRTEPFSAYAFYVQPEPKQGTEAIYVAWFPRSTTSPFSGSPTCGSHRSSRRAAKSFTATALFTVTGRRI